MLFESVAVGLLGAAFGAAVIPIVTDALTSFLESQGIVFSSLRVTTETIALVIGIGVFLGLAAGLIPALHAVNMKIVDGLRRVA